MHLLRDIWNISPRRATTIVLLILLAAGGRAIAATVAGVVLVHRSVALFWLLAAGLVAAVVSDVLIGLVTARLTADWSADVRRRLCSVSFGQDLQTLEAIPVGELLDRIDADVYEVAAQLRGNGIRIGQSLVAAAVGAGTICFLWWPAGVGLLTLSVAIGFGLASVSDQIARARTREEAAWSDLTAVMEESIHGQDDIRTSLGRPYVLRLLAQRASRVLTMGRVVWRLNSRITGLAAGVVRTGIAVVVVGGALALSEGQISSARLTAVWLLALAYGGTVEQVCRTVPHFQGGLGAWARIRQLASARLEPRGGVEPAEGDLTIRGLVFRYGEAAGDREPALRDVNLSFARGNSYALIGRSGSGKSTLAKVLTRAVDIPPKTVFLGDTDLLDLDVEALRRWVALVPQHTDILAGTLAENITLFDPDLLGPATEAIAELGLDSWVADLPEGMDTRLGDGGLVLSAGQEQLLAFARILVRDPRVVILDEATARMDPVTEERVRRATERLLLGRIGIVIAHRLSSVSQCDEVVVLSDGQVVEAGPLVSSQRFARLLAHASLTTHDSANGRSVPDTRLTVPPKTDPPPIPDVAPTRTLREIARMVVNDPRYGLSAVGVFLAMMVFGLEGPVLPWLWADVVDGTGPAMVPGLAIAVLLVAVSPGCYVTARWFPEWWTRQTLRVSSRLVYGQTGPKRVSAHTPAEVVAQSNDTSRVILLADNLVDQGTSCLVIVTMTIVAGNVVPAALFATTIVLSGLTAAVFARRLAVCAKRTVVARASFATALVSSLSAARTVKLAGATQTVLQHLTGLDRVRTERQRGEIVVQIMARSAPAVIGGLLPIGAWAFYLFGGMSSAATLIAVSALGSARWLGWTTASLVSQLPSARIWTRRTVAMTGVPNYSSELPGVDLAQGTAPAPIPAQRHPLSTLELVGFGAVHEDGTIGVSDIDLVVERGHLVLVVGPVGSGKSSLLRALAGIAHHTGAMRWNGHLVTAPERFLRPNQVGYVAQLPRVLSGTVADNIRLGHEVDPQSAVSVAQLEHDLRESGSGLDLVIGHKGTRLSGGQLQRLALARALAPETELLVADDVSSALDVTTELQLWEALRRRGLTVVGSTSKRAALIRADQVVVLVGGRVAAKGTWEDLVDRWGHLAG